MQTVDPPLDEYQREAMDVILRGEHVFITGSAGSGKSYLIRHLLKMYIDRSIVCAPTWSAANVIHGASLHAVFKLHPAFLENLSFDDDGNISSPWANAFVKRLILDRSITSVIIDEISMVSGDMLMVIEAVLRKSGDPGSPFGGYQMIFVGDFSQIPPIEYKLYEYVFQTEIWIDIIGKENTFSLEAAHRQKDDFLLALNDIRLGSDYSFFESRIISTEEAEDLLLTNPSLIRIASRRDRCAIVNKHYIDDIFGDTTYVHSIDVNKFGTTATGTKQAFFSSPHRLPLKIGAKVILTRSLKPKAKHHNGRMYLVKRFSTLYGGSLWDFLCPESKREFGMFKRAKNRLLFSALNKRVTHSVYRKSLTSVILEDEDGEELQVRPFAEIVSQCGVIMSIRIQVPLLLGYAITIHRSQGMTFEGEVLYIEEVFQSGMTYVALSRCKNLDNLYVVGSLPPVSDMSAEVIGYLHSL